MSDVNEDDRSNSNQSSWLDDEFAGKHGTTAATSSVEDEKARDLRPQNAHEAADKIKEESSDQPGVLGKAKKALEEVDRQIGGEYEQREAREAPAQVREAVADGNAQGSLGQRRA